MNEEDLLEIDSNGAYHYKGGTIVMPIESYNDLLSDLEENKQLKDNWNRFNNHLEFLIMNSIGGTKEFIEELLNLSKILRGKDEFRESN